MDLFQLFGAIAGSLLSFWSKQLGGWALTFFIYQSFRSYCVSMEVTPLTDAFTIEGKYGRSLSSHSRLMKLSSLFPSVVFLVMCRDSIKIISIGLWFCCGFVSLSPLTSAAERISLTRKWWARRRTQITPMPLVLCLLFVLNFPDFAVVPPLLS